MNCRGFIGQDRVERAQSRAQRAGRGEQRGRRRRVTIAARAEANCGSNEARKASAPSRPVTASRLASVWLSATGSVGF